MEDIEHLELTPSLLEFYRSRIQELQREQNALILNRLKHIEMSAQERKALEHELLEYRDELDETQQDLDNTHDALVRERRAVFELVEELAQLREICGDISLDSAAAQTDRYGSLRRQYEALLSSVLADHKVYLGRIRHERDTTTAKLQDLSSRCARLETAVMEGTRELIKERTEKRTLQVRVEEMQTSIEQRIQELRRRLDESVRGPLNQSAELDKLKLENKQLKGNLEESRNHLAAQSSAAQDRISQLELQLHQRKQQDYEIELHANPTFRDQIKQIERLALRYAPLQGPDVDRLFTEIEYAKDVIDGIRLPPPIPTRSKSKRKKKA